MVIDTFVLRTVRSAFQTLTLAEAIWMLERLLSLPIGGGRDSGGFYNMMRLTVYTRRFVRVFVSALHLCECVLTVTLMNTHSWL